MVHRATVEEAEPLLAHGLAHACVLDVELSGVQGIWLIEKLRRRDAKCPIIVYTDAKQSEWEEEAYLRGVTHVLTKPVRPRLLTAVLDRLFAAAPVAAPAAAPTASRRSRQPVSPPPAGRQRGPTTQPLAVLRDFSSILTHSLDAEAMLQAVPAAPPRDS